MMRQKQIGVSLGQCQILRTSPKAILVRDSDGSEFWVPNSQVHDDSEVYPGNDEALSGNLVVTNWWAEKEGLV